jgi:hypothetical protein
MVRSALNWFDSRTEGPIMRQLLKSSERQAGEMAIAFFGSNCPDFSPRLRNVMREPA